MRSLIIWTIGILLVLNFPPSQMSYSNEIEDDDDSQTEPNFYLDKKPSWVVGKRIIEFKRQSALGVDKGRLARLFKLISPNIQHLNAIKY